jgi:hypothetical protein
MRDELGPRAGGYRVKKRGGIGLSTRIAFLGLRLAVPADDMIFNASYREPEIMPLTFVQSGASGEGETLKWL